MRKDIEDFDCSSKMLIKRIQVSEGFLDGLNLYFHSDLNVIIGSRGSGKTSIIELIRYCLDVPPIVQRPIGVASRQALQVLGSGRVSVTVSLGDEEQTVSRQLDEPPRGLAVAYRPTIVGTSEIERIGVEPSGRLALIDSFLRGSQASRATPEIRAEVESQIELLAALRNEIEHKSILVATEVEVESNLAELVGQQTQLQAKAPELESDRLALQRLAARHAGFAAEKRELERIEEAIGRQSELLRNLSRSPEIHSEFPRFASAVATIAKVQLSAHSALEDLNRAFSGMEVERSKIDLHMSETLAAARPIRQRLNDHVSGLGTISTQVDQLREQKKLLELSKARIKAAWTEVSTATQLLDTNLERLDREGVERFTQREAIVDRLNKQLGRRIKITLVRAGAVAPYEAEIASLVRGTGIHRTSLALIAKKLSPRELYKLTFNGDVDRLCQAAGVARDRGVRIMEALRSSDFSRLLFFDVEDEVTFWLLVGPDYKPTDYLSTGQRCTAVLPILLAQPRVSLILDQPEDHLDNAFIVETLIEGIRLRKRTGQIIVASHNANVPVLGEAEQVTLLQSDGQHGYVEISDALDTPSVVAAIINVLEGGEVAFARRAAFYGTHAPNRA